MRSRLTITVIATISLLGEVRAALVDKRFDHACYCPSATDPNAVDEKATALRCVTVQKGTGDQKNIVNGKLLYQPTEIKFGYVGASPTRRGFLDASLTRKERRACIRRSPTTQDFSNLDALFAAQGGCNITPNNPSNPSLVVKPICQRFQGPITDHAWKRVSLDAKPSKERNIKNPQHLVQLKSELEILVQKRKKIESKMKKLQNYHQHDLKNNNSRSKKEIEKHETTMNQWLNRPEHWKPLLHQINQEIKQIRNEIVKEEAKPEGKNAGTGSINSLNTLPVAVPAGAGIPAATMTTNVVKGTSVTSTLTPQQIQEDTMKALPWLLL